MMNRSWKALKLASPRLNIGLWLLVGFCSSAAWADQLVMKNGDRVTGSIIKQDGKAITIKSDSFGVITAPWDQVASIQSQQSLNVVLKDGRVLLGAVSTHEGKIRVTARDTAVDVAPGD